MDIRERYRRWRSYRRVVRELREYSNDELAELGMSPYDIESIAIRTVDGMPMQR
jgi:uncharacterized protein YjiS (DUF1127 family)